MAQFNDCDFGMRVCLEATIDCCMVYYDNSDKNFRIRLDLCSFHTEFRSETATCYIFFCLLICHTIMCGTKQSKIIVYLFFFH